MSAPKPRQPLAFHRLGAGADTVGVMPASASTVPSWVGAQRHRDPLGQAGTARGPIPGRTMPRTVPVVSKTPPARLAGRRGHVEGAAMVSSPVDALQIGQRAEAQSTRRFSGADRREKPATAISERRPAGRVRHLGKGPNGPDAASGRSTAKKTEAAVSLYGDMGRVRLR